MSIHTILIQQTCLLTIKLQCSPPFFTLFSGGCGRRKKKLVSSKQENLVLVLIGVFFAGEDRWVVGGGAVLVL
jgi:hypothetical protein